MPIGDFSPNEVPTRLMFCGALERVGYKQRPPPSGNAPLYRVEVMNGDVGCKSLRVHPPFISHDFFEYRNRPPNTLS